ncbi:uncharacterized protein N7482_008627 [Penicillium canariense]|uniref:Prenylated rab acceptor 1 n=1 Tax=Penicillium canariense TaxID=189055 RepID=A0A9W9LIX8_9EURO|nr:uncharacterized protein N7482_008627 [Penicillium canariense]KAJ5157527.1 hypothetical protein N7482_008627 [Penicillium canariense]
MPRWGRPPGARMGRHTRGGRAQWEDEMRVQEIASDEDDAYGRALVRKDRGGYVRQLEYGSRDPRRRPDYDDLTDESESVEGDFDLYDHEDSTVAYAVQLAMRDKEDQLVDTALERIRRAQMLGKKNVRLSQRELHALERKRQQTDRHSSGSGSCRNKQAGNAVPSRPASRRNAPVPEQQPPSQPPPGPYPPFAPEAGWATTTHGRPSSSSSRPRTPTMQSLRPQQSNSPLRPTYPPFPHPPSHGHPQSMHPPMYPRPLPDDPQWAPPYYNPMAMTPYGSEQPLYQSQLPTDLRVGPHSRMGHPSGMSPIQAPPRQSLDGRHAPGVPSRGTRHRPSETDSEMSSEEEEESESSEEEEEEVQVVKVVERQAPPGLQKRTVSGGSRGSRGGRARKSR